MPRSRHSAHRHGVSLSRNATLGGTFRGSLRELAVQELSDRVELDQALATLACPFVPVDDAALDRALFHQPVGQGFAHTKQSRDVSDVTPLGSAGLDSGSFRFARGLVDLLGFHREKSSTPNKGCHIEIIARQRLRAI
jgi:hypothetical protein